MAENDYPEDRRYTEEHEWVKVEGEEAIVGITEFAQSSLGDIVFVELPEPGDSVIQNEPFGSIEAVKAVNDLFSPLSGQVVAVNESINDDPAIVNGSPYLDGWMIRVKISDTGELEGLLSAGQYEEQVIKLQEGD